MVSSLDAAGQVASSFGAKVLLVLPVVIVVWVDLWSLGCGVVAGSACGFCEWAFPPEPPRGSDLRNGGPLCDSRVRR